MNTQRKECATGGDRRYMGLAHPIKFCDDYNKLRMSCDMENGSCGCQYEQTRVPIGHVDVKTENGTTTRIVLLADEMDDAGPTPDQCLQKSKCPECGERVFFPRGAGIGTNPDNTVVWCSEMGHWAGFLREAMKAYNKDQNDD